MDRWINGHVLIKQKGKGGARAIICKRFEKEFPTGKKRETLVRENHVSTAKLARKNALQKMNRDK